MCFPSDELEIPSEKSKGENETVSHINPILPSMTICNLDLLQCSSSMYLKVFYNRDCKHYLHFIKRGLNVEVFTITLKTTGRGRN